MNGGVKREYTALPNVAHSYVLRRTDRSCARRRLWRTDVKSELLSYKSPLHEMTQTTPTCLWNDSAAVGGIFRELGYRIRLLSAAFRNHLHWSEFIGGDVVISPPYNWQLRYNASDVEVVSRIDTLRQFIAACHDLSALMRDFMLPDPGQKPAWA